MAKAFAATELQATAVLDRQSQDLLDREGIGRKEFTRVIPNLLNSDLEKFAYRWIIGDELSDEELRYLGITENIQDALRARMGIQALPSCVKRLANHCVAPRSGRGIRHR